MFTVNYTVSEQDYLDFNLYAVNHNPQQKKTMLLLRLVLPLLLCFVLVLPVVVNHDYQNIIPRAVVYLMISLIWFFLVKPLFTALMKNNVRSQMKKSRSLYSPQGTLYFADDAIRDVSADVTTEIRYEKIEKIVVQNNCIYLFYSPITAILIPFASFSSDAQRDVIMAFLKETRPDLSVEE